MADYRRIFIPNATWFFTVNLTERKNNRLLVDNIDLLGECFRYVRQQKPFHANAIVILPDHLHCIWTVPPNDSNYSIRWNMLKGRFSRAIDKSEQISKSRLSRRERVLLSPSMSLNHKNHSIHAFILLDSDNSIYRVWQRSLVF
jgi:putative transposase